MYETYIVMMRHVIVPPAKFFLEFCDVLVFITQILFVFVDNCFKFYDALVFLSRDQTRLSFNCLGFCFKVLDEFSPLA